MTAGKMLKCAASFRFAVFKENIFPAPEQLNCM